MYAVLKTMSCWNQKWSRNIRWFVRTQVARGSGFVAVFLASLNTRNSPQFHPFECGERRKRRFVPSLISPFHGFLCFGSVFQTWRRVWFGDMYVCMHYFGCMPVVQAGCVDGYILFFMFLVQCNNVGLIAWMCQCMHFLSLCHLYLCDRSREGRAGDCGIVRDMELYAGSSNALWGLEQEKCFCRMKGKVRTYA